MYAIALVMGVLWTAGGLVLTKMSYQALVNTWVNYNPQGAMQYFDKGCGIFAFVMLIPIGLLGTFAGCLLLYEFVMRVF